MKKQQFVMIKINRQLNSTNVDYLNKSIMLLVQNVFSMNIWPKPFLNAFDMATHCIISKPALLCICCVHELLTKTYNYVVDYL